MTTTTARERPNSARSGATRLAPGHGDDRLGADGAARTAVNNDVCDRDYAPSAEVRRFVASLSFAHRAQAALQCAQARNELNERLSQVPPKNIVLKLGSWHTSTQLINR